MRSALFGAQNFRTENRKWKKINNNTDKIGAHVGNEFNNFTFQRIWRHGINKTKGSLEIGAWHHDLIKTFLSVRNITARKKMSRAELGLINDKANYLFFFKCHFNAN